VYSLGGCMHAGDGSLMEPQVSIRPREDRGDGKMGEEKRGKGEGRPGQKKPWNPLRSGFFLGSAWTTNKGMVHLPKKKKERKQEGRGDQVPRRGTQRLVVEE